MDDVFTELIKLMINKEPSKLRREGMQKVLDIYECHGYLPQYRDWEEMTDKEKLDYIK